MRYIFERLLGDIYCVFAQKIVAIVRFEAKKAYFTAILTQNMLELLRKSRIFFKKNVVFDKKEYGFCTMSIRIRLFFGY